MKRKKWLFPVLMILFASATTTLYAQFRFGIKGGANMAEVNFKDAIFASDYLYGFHIGPTVEFMPKLGVGADASILFTQSGFRYVPKNFEKYERNFKNNYIEVPVNIKFKLEIPLISPYLSAGPFMRFRISEKERNVNVIAKEIFEGKGQLKSKSFGAGFNFTAGVEVIKRVQVGVTYNLALTGKHNTLTIDNVDYSGKAHAWLLSAAVLF